MWNAETLNYVSHDLPIKSLLLHPLNYKFFYSEIKLRLFLISIIIIIAFLFNGLDQIVKEKQLKTPNKHGINIYI